MIKGATVAELTSNLEAITLNNTVQSKDTTMQRSSPSLVEHNFYGQGLGVQDVHKIIDAVTNASLEDEIILDLSMNNLGDAGLRAIEKLILDPRVKEIRLDSNQITPDGIEFLCHTLTKRTLHLQALSLSDNNVGVQGANAISNLLLMNYPLTALDLSGCQIKPEGIESLSLGLKNNPFLSHLNLSSNEVTTACAAIAQMLVTNKCLQELQLVACELDPAKASLIGVALGLNSSLKSLNIEGNPLDAPFASQFASDINQNVTLNEYFGPDTPEGSIQTLCDRNQSIPCNTRWSVTYDKDASLTTKQQQLILDTELKPSSTLLFRTTQDALRKGTLTTAKLSTITERVFDASFAEACLTDRKTRQTGTKYK